MRLGNTKKSTNIYLYLIRWIRLNDKFVLQMVNAQCKSCLTVFDPKLYHHNKTPTAVGVAGPLHLHPAYYNGTCRD